MGEAHRPEQGEQRNNSVERVALADEVLQAQLFDHAVHHHVGEVNLHAYAAHVLRHAVVEHAVRRAYGIGEPQREQRQLAGVCREARRDVPAEGEVARRGRHHHCGRGGLVGAAESRQPPPVQVGQAAGDEKRRAKHHALAPRGAEMHHRHKDEHDGHGHRQPRAPLAVEQEHEEREEHIEQENHAEEPPNAYHANLDVGRQQPETECDVGERLAGRAPTRRHGKVNQAQQREEWQYPHVAFLVERRRGYRPFLHAPVVAAAQREAAHHHEQQREIGEERD